MSKSKTIDNFIEELIQEVEEELEEATTSGDAAGYDTPHAFSRKDKKSKKKTKDVATQAGYEVVNESKYKAMIAQDVIETIFKKELSRKFDVIRIDVDHQSGQTEWFKIYLEKKQDPQPIIDYLKRNYGISSKIDRGTRNNVIQLSGNQLVEGKKSNKPRNRWLELKNDDSKTPHKKLAVGLKELKYQLREVEKFLGWYNKIKSMNELETDGYWKRTNKNIRNIKERIINIAQKLKELEQ